MARVRGGAPIQFRRDLRRQRQVHGGQVLAQGREPAEREERYVRYPVPAQVIDQCVVGSMGEVVMVLHADDLADPTTLGNLSGSDVAQSNMTHQTLALEVGEDGQRRLD